MQLSVLTVRSKCTMPAGYYESHRTHGSLQSSSRLIGSEKTFVSAEKPSKIEKKFNAREKSIFLLIH